MSAQRALVYCTVNGICNNTNGLGRQTKILLATVARHRDALSAAAGPFDLHLAGPIGDHMWSFSERDLAYATAVAASAGGAVHDLAVEAGVPFWSLPIWRALSEAAADLARRLRERYEEVLVLGVDTPFAGVATELALGEWPPGVVSVLALYSTAWIVGHPEPDAARVGWERAGLDAAKSWPGARVADIGRFLTGHLREMYGFPADRLAPFPSAVALDDPALRPMAEPEARAVARRTGIPLDRPLVLTVGRTDPTKGIDLLVDALTPLREAVHLVVIAIPMPGHEHLLAEYQRRIAATRVPATVVSRFSRELPRALCALPGTMVVCPSRGETLANVPFEAALWGKCSGAIVVAPDSHGFPEQIDDGVTGILYDPTRPGALTAAVHGALTIGVEQRRDMAQAAAERVHRERDAVASLRMLLTAVWPVADG